MQNKAQCPNCRMYRTQSAQEIKRQDILFALLLTVVTFGAGLLFAIPWLFIKYVVQGNTPFRQYGYHCNDCNYNWLSQP